MLGETCPPRSTEHVVSPFGPPKEGGGRRGREGRRREEMGICHVARFLRWSAGITVEWSAVHLLLETPAKHTCSRCGKRRQAGGQTEGRPQRDLAVRNISGPAGTDRSDAGQDSDADSRSCGKQEPFSALLRRDTHPFNDRKAEMWTFIISSSWMKQDWRLNQVGGARASAALTRSSGPSLTRQVIALQANHSCSPPTRLETPVIRGCGHHGGGKERKEIDCGFAPNLENTCLIPDGKRAGSRGTSKASSELQAHTRNRHCMPPGYACGADGEVASHSHGPPSGNTCQMGSRGRDAKSAEVIDPEPAACRAAAEALL
ncbi:hypothetical protein Purlil1_2371 [Purpureocillium lilacinum]|uniref:Uncharacterized protein n=1 Tax=Purpureocillium lilacinum TaxID=33203 RepID=A0ABR0CAC8_PURLI|nr:hypothetical protein Purlil1_2371 [Purpureocillium lilacinum]